MIHPVRNAPIVLVLLLGSLLAVPGRAQTLLPDEPDEHTRVDEIYDHETRMILFLYSLRGTNDVDYVTSRHVLEHRQSAYGNPVYYYETHPLFYWWNRTMWNDPRQDGVNGNELVYQENIEFDASRYKPCLFNGQPC